MSRTETAAANRTGQPTSQLRRIRWSETSSRQVRWFGVPILLIQESSSHDHFPISSVRSRLFAELTESGKAVAEGLFEIAGITPTFRAWEISVALSKTFDWSEALLNQILEVLKGAFPLLEAGAVTCFPDLSDITVEELGLDGKPVGNREVVVPRNMMVKGLENVEGETVRDADLMCLRQFPQLSSLDLNNTKITDAGLRHVSALTPDLSWLSLSHTAITDAGLEHLRGLIWLDTLWLIDTEITDAGLERLAEFKYTDLCNLELTGTKVTDAGVAAFQRAYPKCKIER